MFALYNSSIVRSGVVTYEIVVHEECEPWLLGLDQPAFDRIAAAIDQVAEHGPGLGRPRVDTIRGRDTAT